MNGDQAGLGDKRPAGTRRARYLIDIVVLLVVSVLLQMGAVAIYRPAAEQSELMLAMILGLGTVAFGWLLLRLRGETLADIGLKQPRSWLKTFTTGLLIAVTIFAFVYLTEKMGFRRDLSRFGAVEGNLELMLYGVVFALIGAGFYEEFVFRGFLLHGLAQCFGGGRAAWIVACVLQGILFGLGHSYQNPFGMALTGTLGMALGFIFLGVGRNLWLPIIAHGLFDASRFVLFYFQGQP